MYVFMSLRLSVFSPTNSEIRNPLSSSEGMVQIRKSQKPQFQTALFFCTKMKQKCPDKILVLGFHAWFLESNNTAPEKQR